MIRFLQIGGWVATALLLITVLIGLGATAGLSAPLAHLPMGLCATLASLFQQSLFLFYYVGISTTLTALVRRERIPATLAARVPSARRVVPLSVATIVGAIAAFTLGGGAHTGAVSPHVHGAFALLALGTAAAAAWIGGRALRAVGRAIAEAEGLLSSR
jgi:hypothetical protein